MPVLLRLALVTTAALATMSTAAAADVSGPDVMLTGPAATGHVSGDVPLTADAKDPDGVLRVNFYVDGAPVGADYSAPYRVIWDSTTTTTGDHEVKVVATDSNRDRGLDRDAVTVDPPPVGDGNPLWQDTSFCSPDSLTADCASRTASWDRTYCVPSAWSLRTVTSPLDGRGTAGRFEVRQGDQGASEGGDRCEIVEQTRSITGMDPLDGQPPTPGGEVRVFAFEALYDPSVTNVANTDFQTFGQWHPSGQLHGCAAQSPLRIAVTGPAGNKRLEFHAQPCYRGKMGTRSVLFSTHLPTNRWVRWVVEVKWSPDPAVGYVRLEVGGAPVQPAGCAADGRCTMATMYSDSAGAVALNHLKLGNYRAPAITFPTVVFYRQVRIGDTRESVG